MYKYYESINHCHGNNREMAKIKSGKAVGYDNMPIEVLRNAIGPMCTFYV